MKNIYFLLHLLIIAGFTGCGDDNVQEIEPAKAIAERLSKIWHVDETLSNQVISPAEDRTIDFTDFSLTFKEDKSYTTTGAVERSPWPNSGTWSFTNPDNITSADQNLFSLTRNDGLIMDIQLADNDEKLEITFDFEEGIHEGKNMRQMAVDGEWKFILVAGN